MYFYQINNLEDKKARFFDSYKKEIKEIDLPQDIHKIPLGFPKGVLFHPPLKNKIYAYVIDNAGRKQYFYTKEYKAQMEIEKFKKFPKLIPKVNKLLLNCQNNKTQICLAIQLMNKCNFRIGHEKYKKLYNTNGTLSINSKHISKKKNKIIIKFNGKKKELNQCTLSNKKSNLYRKLDDVEGPLFEGLCYDDVYEFLKKYGLRPKDIRQVSANREFYEIVRGMPIEDEKKYLKEVLEKTSEKMNHTPSICKKEYLLPDWFKFKKNEVKLKEYCDKNDFEKVIKFICITPTKKKI